MPVSGNEEQPGLLARHSTNSSSGIPIKKRWYSMVHPPESTLNSRDTSTGKSKTSAANVDSAQPFLSISPETCLRDADNQVKPVLAEKLASQEALVTTLVKEEVVGKSDRKLELLPADSGHVELSLGPNEPHAAAPIAEMPETSLLSLSLNKGKDISQHDNDSDDTARANRCNWDLNTPMDSWDNVPVPDASHIHLLHKTSSALDKKPSVVIGPNGDKGKQVAGASEQEFNFPISSLHPSLPYKSADVLRLSLGTTLRGFDSSVLHSFAKVDSSKFSPNSSLLKNLALNIKGMNSPTVKSELVEETLVQANAGTGEANIVKAQAQNLQSIELSTKGPQKLLEKKPVKCEPVQEGSQEICMASDVMVHQSVGRVLQLQESSSSSSSSTLPMPLTPHKGCPSRLSTCSDLSVSGDLSTQSEYSVHTKEANISNSTLDQANADIAAKNAKSDLKESNVSSDKVERSVSAGMNIEDHTRGPNHLVASGEGSAIDEERISISGGTEEECYGSDYESDGNHAFAGHVGAESVRCGREDEEYEDGEVREPVMQSIIEDPITEGTESEINNESSSKNADSTGLSGVGESHCFNDGEKSFSMPVHIETNDDFVKGCDEKADKIDHEAGKLPSPLLDKEETTGADDQRHICAILQGPLDQPGIAADVQEKGCEKEVLCDDAAAGSSGNGTNVGEPNNDNIGGSDVSTTLNSSLQNAETSVNVNSSKDLSNAGSKSRIINLPRASNVTSPSNVRTITGRSLPMRSGRERYFDMEEKFHQHRNRDETYADGPKFVRDRIHDRSFGGSRVNFMRGRGRGTARFDREWDSGRDFESYGGGPDYRFRRKRTAAVGESEIERSDYDIRLDGAAFASNRRRKPLNDALPSFRHPPARRLSPSGRDDTAMMGNQMLRRAPRNISSPSRCTGEGGSELVGLRHSEKFGRDFPADISDPVYSHQQSMYDEPDGRFVRGNNAKFTTMQRRGGFPRMRSKSPVRSRTRSPGPWSSPRRRLTEGFNGLPDSSQHRSPAMYREDRMRSSPRISFTEEMVPRRRDSPSYTARRLNDMRDVDAVQEHGNPRSLSSRRSPPERAFTRNSRRLEILDRRERADGDEYFGGPVHSGRFPDLRGGGGGSTDERRKYGERRGPVRSFRPYNSENENFRFHPDDGPRPFRFYPEANAEYMERSNTREREFDANIKDRPLPRRMRNVEEQEGNFRQSGQLWHEEGFDGSRLKRRRF